ncbi:eukaryotic type KH-domain (KH-domain type I) [Myriangium duriaei CBS 260.36]|uniref:Eukaryotic type KH-domain (KH-domain type I) n=1 Tax=Myriangium duriaei CBS 260.36 TaxID=1168546 RepID=A0A9P4J024_9PEZI|nr:eukaryotic type KH-domain (KH-domain type I) [Myriangium duriaei CBS 260.36]
MATAANPPLYLHITSRTKEGLEAAIAIIDDMMQKDLPNLIDERRFPRNRREPEVERDERGRRKWPDEKIPIRLEPINGFNLRAQVVGQQGMYVKHIQQESGARVQIKGRGSGFYEHDTGVESDEPMYLHVTAPQQEQVNQAKELCMSLLENVEKEYNDFKERGGHRRGGFGGRDGGGGGGYGNRDGGYNNRDGGYNNNRDGGYNNRGNDNYGSYGGGQQYGAYSQYGGAQSPATPYNAQAGGAQSPGTGADQSGAADPYTSYLQYKGWEASDPAGFNAYMQSSPGWYQWYQQYKQMYDPAGTAAAQPYGAYAGYTGYESAPGYEAPQGGAGGSAPPPPPPSDNDAPPPPPGTGGGSGGYNSVPPPPGL